MQTKKHSHYEIMANQIVGIIIGWLIIYFISPLLNSDNRAALAMISSIIFVVASYFGTYAIRRLFNYLHIQSFFKQGGYTDLGNEEDEAVVHGSHIHSYQEEIAMRHDHRSARPNITNPTKEKPVFTPPAQRHTRDIETYHKGAFYIWLGSQFNDLQSAKVFFKKWRYELDEETPFGIFSGRALAAHMSNVLEWREGKDLGEKYQYLTGYIDTKYGSDIFLS